MIIPARLRERMEAQNISQAELARLVGVAQPSIFKLLNGDSRTTRHLHRIARELRTTPAFLSGETDDPTSDQPDEVLSSQDREDLAMLQRLGVGDRAAMRQLLRSLNGEPATSTPAPSSVKAPTLHSPRRNFATGS